PPCDAGYDRARSASAKVIIGRVSVLTISREDPGPPPRGHKWDLSFMQNIRHGSLGHGSRESITEIPASAHLGGPNEQFGPPVMQLLPQAAT
ncbi:Hypothetical predicted protein, partial [Scomber scombrus]